VTVVDTNRSAIRVANCLKCDKRMYETRTGFCFDCRVKFCSDCGNKFMGEGSMRYCKACRALRRSQQQGAMW